MFILRKKKGLTSVNCTTKMLPKELKTKLRESGKKETDKVSMKQKTHKQ